MSAPRPRVAVLLAAGQDPAAWRQRFERGETLDRTPYGYELAERWFDLVWAGAGGPWVRWVSARTSGRLGFDLAHAWHNRRLLAGADVIWTHTEREHLAVALLQRLRRRSRRVPVLAQSVWLWDEWDSYGRVRQAFLGWLLRTHAVEAVHSSLNAADSRARVPGRRVLRVPFGSQGVAPLPAVEATPRPLVLALGNDRHRDWGLLADVAEMLPELDFMVASRTRAARVAAEGTQIRLVQLGSTDELREAYARASVVALPLRPNRHASGLTTAIETLSAGRPLVVTDAGGIGEYVRGHAVLAPAGDAQAFAQALQDAVAGGTAATGPDGVVQRGLTQADYVARYALVTWALLGEKPWDDAVTALAPAPGAADLA